MIFEIILKIALTAVILFASSILVVFAFAIFEAAPAIVSVPIGGLLIALSVFLLTLIYAVWTDLL